MPNDGGRAFPKGFPDAGTTSKGMSLRDWFAGHIVAGMYAADTESWHISDDDAILRARSAYRIADAMLKARENSDA